MALIARASKTVRNKHLIVLAACAVFAVWFGYDGWQRYPAENDGVVRHYYQQFESTPALDPDFFALLERWPKHDGWNQVGYERQKEMQESLKKANRAEGWHTINDIVLQRMLTFALIALVLGHGGWFVTRCQRRRAMADEQGLSPSPGIMIAWADILKVDNTRWKKTGIVTLTYRAADGQTRTAELDDYLLDDLPPVLNEVATRAEKAEFINPEGESGEPSSPAAG